IYAFLAMKIAIKQNKPFIVEVVGDVHASLKNHGSILGKILAPIRKAQYRKIIKKSKYTIYVTEKELQKIYPSAKESYTTNISNVVINEVDKRTINRRYSKIKNFDLNKINIGLIGSYATKYKGIQNAIDLIYF